MEVKLFEAGGSLLEMLVGVAVVVLLGNGAVAARTDEIKRQIREKIIWKRCIFEVGFEIFRPRNNS